MTSLPVSTPVGPSASLRGIAAMLAGMMVFACSDAVMKLGTERLPVSEMITLRGVAALAVVSIWLMATGGFGQVRRAARPIVFGRSGLEAVFAVIYFTALASLGLAEIISVLQAAPLLITLLSIPLLGEVVGWRRWLAAFIGFGGVILIIQPSPEGFNPAAILVLAAAVIVAFRDIATRFIPRDVSSVAVTFITTCTTFLFGIGLSLFEAWRMPAAHDLLLVGLAGVLIVAGNWLVIYAFRNGEMSVISPLRYTIVIWGVLIGFLLWGEVPNLLAIVGITLVVASGIYTLRREDKKAQAS